MPTDIRSYLSLRLIIPLLAGIIALFIPLVRDFHFESALIASLIGCFVAAGYSSRLPQKTSEGLNLLNVLGWIYLPGLVLLAGALLRGCFSVDGLLFWMFNPSLSVLFGYAVGRYFRVNGFRRPGIWANIVLIFVAVFILLFELYSLPQLYFFNHVWGYWPGPIYDEEVAFTTSVILFRFITLCWVGLFWLMPHFWEVRRAQYLVGLVLIGLTLSYLRLSESGVVSPNEFLQQRLGSMSQADHTELFFSEDYTADPEKNRLTALHEFHIAEIQDTLNVESGDRISSYVYPHAWKKKQLTGAKYTSYVPVWNPKDQLHINRQAVDGALRHELVHVITKDFGNRLLNASWSIGLVEGVAVALAPASQRRATVDQMVVANEAWLSPDELEQLFSITGFYRQGGPMSYSIAGSFVQYLLKNYPVGKFKTAFRHSSLDAGYGTSIDSLQAGWKRHLQTVEVDRRARAASLQAFAVPSVFDQDCPRMVTSYQEAIDRYRFHLAEKDTSGALEALQRAVEADPDRPDPRYRRMYLQAQLHRWEDVLSADIPEKEEWIGLLLIRADALKSTGDEDRAGDLLHTLDSLSAETGRSRSDVELRQTDWPAFLKTTYYSTEQQINEISAKPEALQWVWLKQLLEEQRYDILIEAAAEIRPDYRTGFHQQMMRVSEYLAANGYAETATQWLKEVPEEDLQPVLVDQLRQARRFADFVSGL